MDINTTCVKDAVQQAPAAKKGGSGRNSEKRRERSKVAARCRRSKESEIFSELAEFLPLPESTRNSLDKASVMRLSLSDLKLRHVMEKVFSDKANSKKYDGMDELDIEVLSMVNNAMGGFLFVMSTDGDIIYASDSIATHLGLSQVEVMGLSVYDFSHPCDHGDIKEMLAVNKKDGKDQEEKAIRSSTFRMKCTITARGRNVHLRAASYKVIEFTGRMFSGENSETQWFIGIGEPLLHPSDVDIPLNKQTFLTKHSPDMRCEFVDDSVMTFLGYQPNDLIGKSVFEFHHASDGAALARAFKSLYTKGQSVTERYRFLAKHGGWVWVITQATLIQPSNGSKPNSIVCLNFVTSGIEHEDEIMSSVQEERSVFSPFKMALPEVKSMGQPIVTKRSENSCPIKPYCGKETVLPEIIPDSKPIMSTKNVIAPRTEDMDSGFLMPCDDTLIVSKEEPEDLTHLAPIAGDGCVPLDMPIPLLDTLLKEMEEANVPFTFNDNYVEVNFDEVPQLEMPILSSSPVGPEPPQDSGEICGKQSPSLPMSAPSPLFLNSDPPMVSSPGSKSSLLSPFQLSPNPGRTYRSNSDGYSSTVSGSSYEFQASPNSGSGYEDSRSPPALVGLTLQEDTFQAALLMESQLDDPGPSGKCTDFPRSKSSELDFQRCGSPSAYSGAYITLADGRKFPIQMCNSPEYMWGGQTLMNRNTTDTDVIEKIVSPASQEGKISCINNRKNLCELMEVEPKPLIVAKQSLISAPPSEAFDAVLKGGGGRQPWSWNSSADSAVPKLENVTLNSEMPEKMMYKDTSSGPPLAKQPRMSPSVTGGRAGSSVPMEYGGYGDLRKQVGQLGGTVNSEPGMTTANRKIPVRNRNPVVAGSRVPSNVQTMDHNESSIADLGIDLRSCLQKLLSTGRGDKVNEILRLLRDTNCTNDDEDERAQSPGAGKGIGDAGGGPSFGMKSIQNILQANREPQMKLLLNNNRRVYRHGGLLSTLGTTSSVGPNNLTLPGLLELTRQDCEVNAPLNESSCLLSGAELLTALENDNVVDPFA